MKNIITFKHIKHKHLELAAMALKQGDDYYIDLDNFKALIRGFMNESPDFALELTKADLLILINLVSKYRPVEPHTFLTQISCSLEKLALTKGELK